VKKLSLSGQHLKILYFFPHNPYPPRSGAHIRGLEILKGLVRSGCKVYFFSSTLTSETDWNEASRRFLIDLGIVDVFVYQGTLFDKLIRYALRKFYWLLRRELPVDSYIYSPPAMRRWFNNLQQQLNPDAIWMNYSRWDPLIDRSKIQNVRLIIDYHDLVSRNMKMEKDLMANFHQNNLKWVPSNDLVTDENFFLRRKYSTDDNELKIVTNYDRILAISKYEEDLIKEYRDDAIVIHLPVTCQTCFCENSFDGSALFVTGPNVFNLQGFYYFSDRILSNILKECPDFSLWVTGSCSRRVGSSKYIHLLGYVENLEKYYCSAKFAICPVLGGTGQQIKIVEAMAHGLPVISTKYSSSTSPIVHGFNGFIAQDAGEFTGYCIKLWQNPELCKKMGNAARKTIQENFSEDLLLKKILAVLDLENGC
jgi:glycosyltransferase involved in cell wall biosynthesis